MRLTPKELAIPEIGGFTDTNDNFGFRPYAERLANLVGNIEEPLVLVLSGPWGSGKSFFIKQWAGLLRERGAPVIYLDAFSNDHYEDAFLAISAEILAAANNVLGRNAPSGRNYFQKAKKVGTALVPLGLRVVSRTATAGLLSLEDIESGGEALREALKTLGNEGELALERAVSDRLKNAASERSVFETFRTSLSSLAENMAEKKSEEDKNYPLVFIIDEMDRCRPPFALSIIERVKHLFSVPGVCFVLVTHLPQLQTAIQGAYGINFDAQTYMEKFYHLRLTLPDTPKGSASHRKKYLDYLCDSLEICNNQRRADELVREGLLKLFDAHEISLRTIERVMTHISLVTAASDGRVMVIPPVVAGFCIMRQTHPALYDKAKVNRASWKDILRFLQPDEGLGVTDEWSLNWWRFIAGEPMDENTKNEIWSSLHKYAINSPHEIVTYTVRLIDELYLR